MGLKLDSVIKRFLNTYESAVSNDTVRKPISYALYKTWRFVNAYEKERKPKEEKEINDGKEN